MRYKIQHVPLVMLVTFVPTILGILKISELKNSIQDCTSDVICVLTVDKILLIICYDGNKLKTIFGAFVSSSGLLIR